CGGAHEPAGGMRELDLDRGRVRGGEAGQGDRWVVLLQQRLERSATCLVFRHRVIAVDRREVGGIRALHRGRAIPGVEDILGGELVAVRERHVLAELECVGQSIRRSLRDRGREVRNDVQVFIELDQAVEYVLL